MTWRIEIRVRIGREPAKHNAQSEQQPEPPSTNDLSGSLIERSEQPAALIDEPIGFRPAPTDARRSGI